LIHELARVSTDLFEAPCVIPRKEIVFDIDNDNIPLDIEMNNVYEINQGN